MLFVYFIGFCIVLGALIRMFMAVYTPNAYEKLLAEDNRKRERRNATLKKGIGLAFRFMGK